MFGIPDKHPVPWSEFEGAISRTGETAFFALEQKRYEECSVAPSPGNDAVVGAGLVLWSNSVISVMKQTFCNDWSQGHVGWHVEGVMKMIPEGLAFTVITESSDVALGFKHCVEQLARGCNEPEDYTSIRQWLNMLKTIGEMGIKFWARNNNKTFTWSGPSGVLGCTGQRPLGGVSGNGKKTPQGKILRPRFEEGWPIATHVSRLTLDRPSLVCLQLRTLRESS
jgi:hypothetical protein